MLTAAPTSVPSAQLRAPLKVTTQLAGAQVLQVFKGPPPSSLASPTIRLLPARRPLLCLACLIATRDLEPLTHCSRLFILSRSPQVFDRLTNRSGDRTFLSKNTLKRKTSQTSSAAIKPRSPPSSDSAVYHSLLSLPNRSSFQDPLQQKQIAELESRRQYKE